MLKIAFAPIYQYPLPDGHRFPMIKYELIPEQLLYEGTVEPSNFFRPSILNETDILATHDADYWQRLKNLTLTPKEIRATGFPLSAELVRRETIIAQGTIECAKYALQYGVSMNIAGGTHHAFTNRGEGFCLLNDVGIATNWLLNHQLVERVLVIDLDVHQGNGTAEIFQNEPNVFTFSMHGAKNYPLRKEKSDLDIDLPDSTNDEVYLKILKTTLPDLIKNFDPNFIFYIAGVDVLATDKLGRLDLSIHGCKMRDEIVLETCKHYNIPVAISMGGGYSKSIALIVEAHANTYRLAQKIFF